MRTSKPISTISYNSVPFLQSKMDEFVRNHVISAWFFVKHRAEKDERKDHIHVYAVPNKMVDTMALQDALRELDPENPQKALGCIDFCSSNPDDASLYFAHNEEYLAWKGETREYHYGEEAGPISSKLYNRIVGIQKGLEEDTYGWCMFVNDPK